MFATLFRSPLLVSVLAYAGLALLSAALVSLLHPVRLLHIRSRRGALALLPPGLALALCGAWWPWPERLATGATELDAFVPSYQFDEHHEIEVDGSPEAVYRALRAVTADEIRWFRLLTWIRSPRLPGRERPESILEPAWGQPILDVATRSGFVWLADVPHREALVGTLVCCGANQLEDAAAFRRANGPGLAKAAMNFRIEPLDGGGCRLTTETRVAATDPWTRRRFGLYWALIYPGSSLIRHGWLEAIERRTEGTGRAS